MELAIPSMASRACWFQFAPTRICVPDLVAHGGTRELNVSVSFISSSCRLDEGVSYLVRPETPARLWAGESISRDVKMSEGAERVVFVEEI